MNRAAFTITLATIAIILAITNPSLEEHKAEVKNAISGKPDTNKIMQSDSLAAETVLKFNLADKLLDRSISRDSYVFFSLTKGTYNTQPKTIGVGFMGNVFITKELIQP